MHQKSIWFFEEVDLYEMLCPYKYKDHLKTHPLSCYNKTDFLFMEGDPVREIFLVAEGKVKVSFYDSEGNEQVIAFLSKGEILGETALIGQARYREFAQAVVDRTMICKLGLDKARELMRDYVPFSLTITKRFGEKNQRLERRLQILLFKDARQRLIAFIKDLCRDIGTAHASGTKVELDITQSDIAALIGASRKTVSLLFTDLETEGLVRFNGRKELFVSNLDQLV